MNKTENTSPDKMTRVLIHRKDGALQFARYDENEHKEGFFQPDGSDKWLKFSNY